MQLLSFFGRGDGSCFWIRTKILIPKVGKKNKNYRLSSGLVFNGPYLHLAWP